MNSTLISLKPSPYGIVLGTPLNINGSFAFHLRPINQNSRTNLNIKDSKLSGGEVTGFADNEYGAPSNLNPYMLRRVIRFYRELKGDSALPRYFSPQKIYELVDGKKSEESMSAIEKILNEDINPDDAQEIKVVVPSGSFGICTNLDLQVDYLLTITPFGISAFDNETICLNPSQDLYTHLRANYRNPD